jgi:hypothetical protein
LEYYYKKGADLIGDVLSDPTSGFIIERSTLATKRINYANMVSKGINVDLHALLIDGMFKWQMNLLFSYSTNKITKYNSGENNTTLTYLSTGIAPAKQGVSPDAFYSIPWNGLNPQTGGPLIYLNGAVSNDYTTYYNGLKPADLINNGVSVPPYFGSLRNTFQWKKLELSVNLTWKSGYYFRRNSINYNSLFSQWNGHTDFTKRWQQPGDEAFTQVPAMPAANDLRRDFVYSYSLQLAERGDHIRLQDISLNYIVNKRLQVYAYARDLGIIWRENNSGIDPDLPNASYPNPQSYSVGLRASF